MGVAVADSDRAKSDILVSFLVSPLSPTADSIAFALFSSNYKLHIPPHRIPNIFINFAATNHKSAKTMKQTTAIHYYIYTLLAALLTIIPTTASADNGIQQLLHRIDRAIENSDKYVAKKTARINILRDKLAAARTPQSEYQLSYRLYQEYLPFTNDSAIHYLERCTDIARRMGDNSRAGGCTALMALSCSNAGLYLEAETILKGIHPEQLRDTDLGLYCYARAHMSGEMAFYGNIANMRRQYSREADEYRQRLLRLLPPTNRFARQCRETMATAQGNHRQALALNDQWLQQTRRGSADYALVTFYRYVDYKALGDSTQMMHWLAESVLSDVENAVMDQGSMWEMANLLMSAGDVDRSYRYICFTSDCADRFGSRQRLSRISPLLSRIAKSYKTEVERKNKSLRQTIAAISILSLVLLAALFYVYRKRNQLATTRDQLAQSNRQLKDSNSQLSALNTQLSALNTQLTEANKVKEEYVGRFMRLCSLYIDKLDDLRKKVKKRVKNKQYAELAELTHSAEFKDAETDELYDNFDTAFLHLFPTFVEDFNTMLKPECRITLNNPRKLTTVLRIFALIRLGITDSSKIAEFLHYSVNTIYNYRANTKNGAVCDRAVFEDRIKSIGMV